ncbi:hypothetical protein MRB53_015591 [Persea americana]|uniref:Uncharacterized protein n=1 Tax=Persea americana TaxID=3435 RepID=A0ACC2M112_PERAE|nr:hypothetical protein MRB53_015591 [Persea americana]
MSSMLLVAPSFTLCNLQNPKLPKSLSKTPPPPLSLKPQTTLQTLSHNLIISGPSHLSGHVRISGSKNSALPVLAAALCCSEGGPSILRGIPDLSDVTTMISILQSLGARIDVEDGGLVVVDAEGIGSVEPCSDSVGRIRAGFFVVGPLVGRFGEAVMALPGGCEIGSRPIDLFVRGLRALSAVVEVRHGKLHVCAANGKGLIGGRFHLDYPSVGATETLMMAASVANGVTVLTNAAQEPEVADLARFLVASGASIEGAGTSTVIISGRKKLHGTEFTIIPGRIEAGTFMVAAAITRSCISMGSHLLEVSAISAAGSNLQAFDFKTCPYPGFPTDLQPQFMALLATCNGAGIVEESVFEGRMRHVGELQKLGAKIETSGNSAVVWGNGQSALSGSHVVATDLRAGASLVLARMAAQGTTEIAGAAHIDRGYEKLEVKLHLLGANIRREQQALSIAFK